MWLGKKSFDFSRVADSVISSNNVVFRYLILVKKPAYHDKTR